MTAEPNRQPEGIPTGGQFATKVQSDDVPSLTIAGQPGSGKGGSGLVAALETRDALRERRDAVYEEMHQLNAVTAAYSAQALAAQLISMHPDAATLTIGENVDGNGWYDIRRLQAADGTVLEDVDDDDKWTYAEAPNGTYVEEFVNDLPFGSDGWAEGIAKVESGNKYDYKKVTIDLKAALAKQLPAVPVRAE